MVIGFAETHAMRYLRLPWGIAGTIHQFDIAK